jgi:hypothetical protein
MKPSFCQVNNPVIEVVILKELEVNIIWALTGQMS